MYVYIITHHYHVLGLALFSNDEIETVNVCVKTSA